MHRPKEGDFNPYYSTYIDKVPNGNPIELLDQLQSVTQETLSDLPAEKENFRYAEGKWTVKEVVQHLIDTEKVMAYRAMCISRGETVALPGFNQDDYALNANVDNIPLRDLLEEFKMVRASTRMFYKHIQDKDWSRAGTASNSNVTVSALAYIILGHEIHHLNVLNELYLNS